MLTTDTILVSTCIIYVLLDGIVFVGFIVTTVLQKS